MYSLRDYGDMIADSLRMDAYALALKSVIEPETVVLDIGAATGIHALLACKFGAKHVYAIEPNEHITLAQAFAQENDFEQRITFIQDLSTAVTLPEKVDVIVSDLRGALPLFGEHIPSIVDARQRHLRPGGVLIPEIDRLYAAVVRARSTYIDLIRPWAEPYGLKMETGKNIALNSWYADNTDLIYPRHLLTEPALWATLDYQEIENPHIAPGKLTLQAVKPGIAHGLLLWFDTDLSSDIGFGNGPGVKNVADVYGRGFFPFLKPVELAQGDVIEISLAATLENGAYEWDWQTSFYDQAGSSVKTQFDQSTTHT